MQTKDKRKEFGDYQTPVDLAGDICALLRARGIRPSSVVEPTCGKGNLLLAALDQLIDIKVALGIDIDPDYIKQVKQRLMSRPSASAIEARVFQADFFNLGWNQLLSDLPDPVLIIGNPPWVTNSELATFNGKNLPRKSNFHDFSGLDAKTGKSNFDISEWMLIHLLESLGNRDATIAMLCKTSVARQVLAHAWKRDIPIANSSIYLIDARETFDASVDACLLVSDISIKGECDQTCRVYERLSDRVPQTTFGYRDHQLIANVVYYERWKHLENNGRSAYRWRSGIKHDCAKVMELKKAPRGFRNRLGTVHDLESDYLYPMLKSSDIANERAPQPSKWMLVTQKSIGEDTTTLQYTAPRTWAYLNAHHTLLDKRKSSIYEGQPRFSVFGVGDYSFSPWKVAISGLYKKLHFALVGPYAGKPVVLDDTCYFIPCQSEAEAQYLMRLLDSDATKEFLRAFIFWDAKRPITISVLKKLDLAHLARTLGDEDTINGFLLSNQFSAPYHRQLSLFNH